MAKVKGLGHVGIAVTDLAKMTKFYAKVLGLTVTDAGGPGASAVFMSADPAREQHEFVLGSDPDRHANAQQISFTVGSLDDLRELHHAISADPECSDIRVLNHGIAIGCYFRDPENNQVEVYWSTGMDYVQPEAGTIDLDQSNEDILGILDAMPAKQSHTSRHYGQDKGKRILVEG